MESIKFFVQCVKVIINAYLVVFINLKLFSMYIVLNFHVFVSHDPHFHFHIMFLFFFHFSGIFSIFFHWRKNENGKSTLFTTTLFYFFVYYFFSVSPQTIFPYIYFYIIWKLLLKDFLSFQAGSVGKKLLK